MEETYIQKLAEKYVHETRKYNCKGKIFARQYQKELLLVKKNGGDLMDKDPFKEYIKQSEPSKRDK